MLRWPFSVQLHGRRWLHQRTYLRDAIRLGKDILPSRARAICNFEFRLTICRLSPAEADPLMAVILILY
jgi:hypothetical protein